MVFAPVESRGEIGEEDQDTRRRGQVWERGARGELSESGTE